MFGSEFCKNSGPNEISRFTTKGFYVAESLEITGRPMRKNGGAVEIRVVPLKQIKLSRNSRMNIRDEELTGLMASIKEEGLLEPIGLVKVDKGYEICYGNRRFLSCSKLGYSSIPAVIHDIKDASDIDMKNLAENVQRRSINIQEAGRYMELLEANGLTQSQIAVRLGVTGGYISTCLAAYREVPEEFRKDLDVRVAGSNSSKAGPGKISIKVASEIINAQKSGFLTRPQARSLLKEARDNVNFKTSHLPVYAAAMRKTKRDPKDIVNRSSEIDKYKMMAVRFLMKQADYDALKDKYCVDGPFTSVQQLCLAILRGEKSVQIKMLKKNV